MIEIETRAKLKSKKQYSEIEHKLVEAGYSDLGKLRLKDVVYGTDGLYSVKKRGFCYRIRQHGDQLIVDRKGKLPTGWSEEILTFDDSDSANEYFINKGLLPYLIIDRFRHEFQKGRVKIALDDVSLLGQYIEIERVVENESEIEDAKKSLAETISDLAIDIQVDDTPYGWLLTLKLEKDSVLAETMAQDLGISVKQLFQGPTL